MKVYIDTVKEVLERGVRKENRTGVDTISAFNINYTIDMDNGFPLLTTKEISWKNIVVENLWFLYTLATQSRCRSALVRSSRNQKI